MANTANMTLTTNFNVTPYYDDYDETKGYYRILFKPGFAVQGRELTQMQTMLQKQIDRFGRHFFEEGSIVIPGLPELFASNTSSSIGPANYVKVKDVDDSNNDVDIAKFDGITVTGVTSGVNAVVNFTQNGLEIETVTKTLFVDYTSASSSNSSVVRFSPGEKLVSNVGNLIVLASNASPIGYGSAYRISSGVVFSKGHFVYFPTQEVVLDPYNPSPTCRVGFKIYESIISNSEDSSLLDPALEASNYSAPGADRFKMIAELQKRDYDDKSDLPDFVSLFSIKDGIVETFTNKTTYSIIRDEFARRTFNESGDYYVNGLNVELKEHKKTNTNGGLFANGNPDLISVKIDPGVAYVKGYEVGTISPTYITTPKSTEYANVTDQIVSAFLGSYVTIDEMIGQIQLDKALSIDLYDTAQNRISSGLYAGLQTGNKIGSANVAGIEYNSGIVGTANGRSDLYLMDVQMLGTNSFSQVKSLYVNNPTLPDFGADVVLNPSTNSAVLNEAFNSVLLYYTGSDFTREIRDRNDLVTTRYYYGTTRDTVTVPTSGPFTVDDPLGADLPYTGTLSTSRKREIFFNLNSSVNVATGWTVSNNGLQVIGTASDFTRFSVGDKIEFGVVGSGTRIVTSVTNATHMIVNSLPGTTVSSAPLFKAYKAGDFIDLTTKGVTTGVERTVSASGPTFTINLQETFPNSVGASVSFKAAKRIASPAGKILRPSRYVKIDCSANPGGTVGPYNLGITDVYRIKSIRKDTSSFPASNTAGVDVTTQFTLDNGQRDTHYDHARLIPKSTLSSTDRLLVELDYFYPNFSESKGHFNVESYPVNDNSSATDVISTAEIPIYKSPTSGKTYDLRNHLDFRPVKSSTATDATDPTSASTDPVRSSAYLNSSSGLNLVFPSSDIEFDYSYYLARKDVVHVNKDRIFSIKKGVPSITPITPEFSDNEMALAVLTIAPYPSISPYFAKLIGRQDTSSSVRKVAPVRHTMREIGVMKERIGNLEYYAALSLLEKNALDMMVPDENGLDRFKNGIFVDTFTDHLLGDTGNEDYRIVVDPKEKSIRPLYSMQSIKYNYLSGTNIAKTGDLVTLSYTEAEFANVSSATSTLNTERSTYRFIGNMTLIPGEDIWIDTKTLPPNCISINDANLNGLQDAQQVGGVTTTWNAWQTNVVGYKVYQGEGVNKTLVGSFTTRAEADRAAQNARTTSLGATVETLYQSNRTGTESFTYADADTASIGTRVVDTQIIPYIRAQTIMGSVTGLKPFAKFDTFFDSIKMSAYVRPLTEAEFGNVSSVKSWTYVEGAELRANENGELWFRLRLPENDNLRFTVGQKNVMVTDSATNSDVATSFAERTFFAQGVIQTKQDTILSTRQVEIREKTIAQSTDSSTFSSLPPLPPPPPPPPPDNPNPVVVSNPIRPIWPPRREGGINNGQPNNSCLAYVMPIKAPAGEEGLFLTSVEVFCAEKHPTLGMWVEVRELDAGGGITKNQVPFSEKWFRNSQVPISTNGKTNGLKITFDSPIFLYADKSYAFIIHPEAANPNYYFWVSRIGETDVNTGEQVTGRAYYGTTFTTNNDTIWVSRDEIDITCKWYRAKFNSSGSFVIGNTPKEKIYIDNIQGSIEGFGEPLITGDILTISGGPAIVANDFIVGTTSSVNSKVMQVASGKYSMSNIRYAASESVTIYNGTTGASKGTATISAIENGRGYMEYYKETPQTKYIILNESNGLFKANDIVFDISDEGYGTVTRIEDLRYSLIDFEPAIITFSKTTNSYEMAAYSNTGSAVTGIKIDSGENFEFAQDMKLMSRSNENAVISGDRSNKVTVTFGTTSDYLSPVFDLGKTQSIIVDNLINSNTVGESAQSGGQLFNKYISKIVTLAENQDAEDIKVYATAYRPPGTDVKVWIKILNGEDSDTMTQRPWIEMEKSFGGDITYSSLANKNDFKEYTYNIPASYMTSPDIGAVQYVNSQGITLTRFKSFQIKIGLVGSSTESYKVPRVADLRTIAVQM